MPEFDTREFEKVNMDKYAGKYSEKGFSDKVSSAVKAAGLALIYKALQLYYVTKNPACPTRIKAGIFAALGYFISPLDILPDFTPIVGYSDDAAAVALAIGMAQIYIDDEVKQKAKKRIAGLFGENVVELD